jgi:hypothetical protein
MEVDRFEDGDAPRHALDRDSGDEPVRIRCHIPGLARLAAVFTVARRPESRVTV